MAKTDKYLVSVLIPCYNHGSYIDDAVNSVLSQSHTNLEIIIVDAGSNDLHTKQKLKNYSKPKTKVLFSNAQIFPSEARNIAFSKSSGDFILTLDADDLIEKTFVRKTLARLLTSPGSGAASSKVLYFGYEDGFMDYMGGNLEDILQNMGSHLTALIRRRAWTDICGFDETFNDGFEDWEFWFRLTKAKWTIEIIPEILVYYRQKESSRVTDVFIYQDHLKDRLREKHYEVYKNPFKYLKSTI